MHVLTTLRDADVVVAAAAAAAVADDRWELVSIRAESRKRIRADGW